jgi:hypothetical protein
MWGFVAIAGLAAVLAAVFLTLRRRTTVGEIASYQADVGSELARYIEVVNSVNDRRDAVYVQAVEALRGSTDDVLSDATRLLSDESDAPFALRHSTLLALGAMRDPATLDVLADVALNPQPLPPRETGSRRGPIAPSHGAEALEASTILALDALDGVEALADDGNAAALETLVEATVVDSNAVRAVALAALAAKPERSPHLERAMAELPKGLRHLAQLRRVSVEGVPQVEDPRVHLAGEELDGTAAPDIDDGAARPGRTTAPEHGAPPIREG